MGDFFWAYPSLGNFPRSGRAFRYIFFLPARKTRCEKKDAAAIPYATIRTKSYSLHLKYLLSLRIPKFYQSKIL
ncbi:hypothetical protein OA84_05450 [Kaistella solincola]|uniref:Uncharacterized protein n=1 Tax=Kaistella solincola TaxID=510955 RepID=A0ABR4ZQH2_9FLAO|nr:hypothetical protein OA84_05450 [Kaistella solincola]